MGREGKEYTREEDMYTHRPQGMQSMVCGSIWKGPSMAGVHRWRGGR